MSDFSDLVKKHSTETPAKPEIEPSAEEIAFAREYRGLYLSLVRSGFTKDEAQSHLGCYLMMHYSSKRPQKPKPWERE